jgi:hypothetical protein
MKSLGSARILPAPLTGVLLALIIFGAALGAATVRAAATPVTTGSLTWGVKASFVSYITGPIASGEVALGGGATAAGAQFRFPGASGTADGQTGAFNVAFQGNIRFSGHDMGAGPLLDVKLENLRVVTENGVTYLVADAVSKSLQSAVAESYPNLKVARLNFAGITPSFAAGSLTYANVPAELTADGVPAFADFYPSGTALDPVTIVITVAGPPASPTTGPGSSPTASPTAPPASPTTTSASPKVTVSKTAVNPAGDTVTVTGTGFLPALATAARPPLAGQPAGVYIVFGAFAENWKPSAGAPSGARPAYSQDEGGVKWAVLEASRPVIGVGTSVTLNPDGSFTAVISVKKDYAGALADGKYGIYTYPGAGAVQPLYETFTPLTFAQAPKPPAMGSGLEAGGLNSFSMLAVGAGATVVLAAGGYVVFARRRL